MTNPEVNNPEELCEAEVRKNLVLVELGMPLTIPLSRLNSNCHFRKEWMKIQHIWHGETKEVREKKREYNQRPEVKEKRREKSREYNQRPEVKEKRRENYQRPEVKEKMREKMREYNQRPEVKEKRREKRREYNQRPEVKEKRRENYLIHKELK